MVWVIKEVYGLDSPKVFSAMLKVSREKFVSKMYQRFAYRDSAISIGDGQTMSQPYTVAFMTHLLAGHKVQGTGDKTEDWRVLEVGTGSGYQAAVLSELVKEVYTVEIVEKLAKKARKTLKKLKIDNVFVKSGNGAKGWKEKSPFDAIIITAALEKDIPSELIKQLKVGRIIVAPIGPRRLQTMTRLTKSSDGRLEKEEFDKYVFVPFVGE